MSSYIQYRYTYIGKNTQNIAGWYINELLYTIIIVVLECMPSG